MQLKTIVATLALLLVASSQIAYGASDSLEDVKEYVFTDYANSQSLVGSAIKIGVWEAATRNTAFSSEINSSRSELSGRVTVLDNHVNISYHATNVALILASNSNNDMFDGMATDIEIIVINQTFIT
ncbi:hypothetical protein [Methanolobus sp.]|uniref:hypothetical protein n=1 Tax=Methanolobus sp. TaxID=1874737 RepID=UPI0025F46D63|nr:hypothetical protein [Methanolobus sp.]